MYCEIYPPPTGSPGNNSRKADDIDDIVMKGRKDMKAKKLLSVLLVLCMVFTMMPMGSVVAQAVSTPLLGHEWICCDTTKEHYVIVARNSPSSKADIYYYESNEWRKSASDKTMPKKDFVDYDNVAVGGIYVLEDTKYVVCKLPTFTVTFNANGHGIAPDSITDIEYEYTITAPTEPTAEGYVFGGWYKEAACVTAWDFDSDEVTDDITLYAKWTQDSAPLTFTAEEANSTITFDWASGTDVKYSTDGTEWTDYTAGTAITLANVDDTVSFKGTNVTTSTQKHFVMTGKIAASGDVTSLTNGKGGDVTYTDSSCNSMFFGCTALTAAPNLPATKLADSCYALMFRGCTALTEAPALPATAMAQNCYNSMFYGCTALTTAPTLPAEALAKGCYDKMFYECKKLATAPELPAPNLAQYCYRSMFKDCTALTAAPNLPATNLEQFCYQDMFGGCKALTAAPELPATTLVRSCYQDMFNNCTSLTSAPELKATTLDRSCYQNMFKNCTGLKVVRTSDKSEATWIFPETSANSWNSSMISGLTATGTLTTVAAEEMYKVTAALTIADVIDAIKGTYADEEGFTWVIDEDGTFTYIDTDDVPTSYSDVKSVAKDDTSVTVILNGNFGDFSMKFALGEDDVAESVTEDGQFEEGYQFTYNRVAEAAKLTASKMEYLTELTPDFYWDEYFSVTQDAKDGCPTVAKIDIPDCNRGNGLQDLISDYFDETTGKLKDADDAGDFVVWLDNEYDCTVTDINVTIAGYSTVWAPLIVTVDFTYDDADYELTYTAHKITYNQPMKYDTGWGHAMVEVFAPNENSSKYQFSSDHDFNAPAGKQLVGWTETENGTTAFTFGSPLTKNVELYPIWGDAPSFDLRDGTTPTATAPTNPTNEDYTFAGWYTKPDGAGTKLDNVDDAVMGTTYYAKWTKTFGEGSDAVTHTVLTQPIKVDADGIYVADSGTPVTKLEGYGIEVKDGKLCLDNATVDASAVTKDYADEWQRDTGTTPCRVSAIATDLSVVLTGDNTVYGSDVAGESWALYCGTGDSARETTYEISGEGTLTVDSGSCAANYAVSSTGKLLKLSAKEITITANDGDTSEGIYSMDSGLEITGGTVTVTAGNADTSYGIFLVGGLTVSGGTVTVTAGTADSMSCGIFLMGGLTVTDGAITACGETSAVYANGRITANGATIVAGNDESSATSVETYGNQKYMSIAFAPIFDLRDGSVTTEQPNYTEGEIPEGSAYTFAGWYTGIDGTGTKLTGDPADGTTYYAHWTNEAGKTVLTEGIEVKEDGVYIGGSAEAAENTELEKYGLAFTAATTDPVAPAKLTMTNAAIDTATGTSWTSGANTFYAALRSDVALTIELKGENSIRIGDGKNSRWGINGAESLTFTGEKLTVTCVGSSDDSSCGVKGKGITNSATLTVTAGNGGTKNTATSTGVRCETGVLNNSGTLTATAGNAPASSYGISGTKALTNSGTLTATAGNATTYSYGVAGLNITNSGTLTATAGTATNAYGVYDFGALTVTGGKMTSCGKIEAKTSITAADAIVTGATGTFTSGKTTTLTQSGAAPIVISFKTSVTFDENFKPVNGGKTITFSDSGTSYDVTAPTVSVGGNALDPQPTMTYTYYQNTGSDGTPVWTPLNPNEKPTNAGSYKVVIAVSDNNPAYAGSKEYTFSIAKADVEAPALADGVNINYANEKITPKDGYEVSTTSGENFATGKFTSETTIDFTKTYYIRKAADGNHNASEEASYKPQRPATPAAPTSVSKTDTTVTLTVVTGCEYSRGGTTWQDSNEFTGLTAGQMYSFYQRVKVTGSSFKSASSEALSVTTKTAPASAPSVTPIVTATTVTLPENSTYEYSTDGQTWNSIREFSGLTPASAFTYYVRIKGTDTAMPSQTAPVTGYTAYAMPATVGETGAVNYTDETFDPNSGYEISKSNEPFVKETLTDGKLTIEPNTTYYIRKAATTTPAVPASATVSLTIPERPAAPAETAFTKTAETVANKKDGSFGGITVAMEYSTDGGTTWTSGPKTLTDLSNETVKVRYKATTEAFKSEEYSYTFTPSTAKLTVTMGENSVEVAYDSLVSKPADPEKSGYTFGGWYTDEAFTQAWNFGTDTVTGNITLYPKWIRNNVQKAAITGKVKENSTGVPGATVELYLGTVKVAATVTGGDGSYVFDNVENGIYNIVVTKADGKTKTELVTVDSTGSFTADVELPTKAVSSKVEHKGTAVADAKSDIKETVVGGLDAVAVANAEEGKKVTVKLTVEPKAESDVASASEIKALAGNGKKVEFLDMSLWKQVNNGTATDIGDGNTQLLTIVIPFDFTGVDVRSVMILRNHGGNTEKLTGTANANGEYFKADEQAGTLTIFAKKFSDYAVAYAEQSTGGHGGGSYTTGHTVTSDLKNVTKVTIDGKVVDSKYYTVSGGNIILSGEFMKTLTNGKHTVKLYDGLKVATGTITVTGNTNVASAATGDMGVALYAALSVSSILGMGWVGKKKRDDE